MEPELEELGCNPLEGRAKSGPPGVNWTAANPLLLVGKWTVVVGVPGTLATLRLGDDEPFEKVC